ncbi:MAG: hypothetical protein U9R19_08810 [Bacteroidota bacterium]|nr:hypothetical protein [Bacteroidota bacterium]
MLLRGVNNILFLVLILAFIGCNRKSDPPYEFKDQNLQGKIITQQWSFVDGVARLSPTSNDTLLIGLYNIHLDQDCSYAVSEEGVNFFVPNHQGIFQLASEWESPQSVTLYSGIDNEHAWRGAIEITQIDTVNNRIYGNLDATVDDESSVNGKFSVSLCK